MMSSPREGVIAALWSPTDEYGDPLVQELKDHLQFVRSKGVHAVMALGSTGEFLYLDPAQRKLLVQEVISSAESLPVIANISDLNPRVVAELGRFARSLGAAAVALLPPYFYPMAQEDLVEFFVRGAEAANLPLFLYNFPERTGNRIGLETVAAVADRVLLAGVKQSGGEFDYHRALVQLAHQKNFVVLTGADTQIVDAMSLGVAGCVSGLANAVPELVVAVYEAVRTQHSRQTEKASKRMSSVGELVEKLEFPLNVRAAMEARGLPVGGPKSIVSSSTRSRYEQLVGDLKELFRQWNLI